MDLDALAQEIIRLASHVRMSMGIAESCTGGMVAAALTGVAGASSVFDCGLVTYSNRAKQQLLGVSSALLDQYGAVSAPCSEAMAKGVIERMGVDVAISVTGIAGPSGGSVDKPVGLVYLSRASKDEIIVTQRHVFTGNRAQIRMQATKAALSLLRQRFQTL